MGIKDQWFLDEVHGKLYAAGKIHHLDEPIPIACPTFIIWRIIDDKKKDRVMVDL